MGVGVVADNVPLLNHSGNQFGILLNIGKGYEEGGGDLFLFQGVEYFLRTPVFVAAVKGEIYYLVTACIKTQSAVFFV